MLFKSIIGAISRFVYAYPAHPSVTRLRVVADAQGQTVDTLLNKVVIRDVGNLRQIIPEAFPKKLRNGALVATTNIHNAWRVDPLMGKPQKWQILL